MQAEELLTMTTDTLLEMRETWRTEGRHLLDLANQAEFSILQRLLADGATVYASEQWEAKVSPGAASYTYDLSLLALLDPLLRPGERGLIVTYPEPQPVVDKRLLNGLSKRGGEIAELISRAVTAQEGPPRLSIKRLQELE